MKKLLLIDCYDSFTDILAQSLESTGLCRVEICPYDEIDSLQFPFFDAFVLSPGPGLPYEYPQIFSALQALKARPVLGICMGHQIIGLACGGELMHLEAVVHGQMKNLQILGNDKVFDGIVDETPVGLYHSWVLHKLPPQLKILAMSSEQEIMAIRHEMFPWVGFQFHPESYMTEDGVKMLMNWLTHLK